MAWKNKLLNKKPPVIGGFFIMANLIKKLNGLTENVFPVGGIGLQVQIEGTANIANEVMTL